MLLRLQESYQGKISFISYITYTANFQRFDLFSRIQQIPTNPNKSSGILSTIAHNKYLKIRICKSQILMNPDLACKAKNLKNLICIDSKGFVHDPACSNITEECVSNFV